MFGASRMASALAVTIAGLLALIADTVTAEAAEEGASLPVLEVMTRPHYEPEFPSQPGRTEVNIRATFGWDVQITVRAHGATVLAEESPIDEEEFDDSPGELHTSLVRWSCKQPGTVYSYVVTATPNYMFEPVVESGEQSPLTKSGTFVGASRQQCEQAPRIARREHRAEVRRQREQALASRRLYEANCRAVGGKPAIVQTDQGPYLVCRSQTGGIVEV